MREEEAPVVLVVQLMEEMVVQAAEAAVVKLEALELQDKDLVVRPVQVELVAVVQAKLVEQMV